MKTRLSIIVTGVFLAGVALFIAFPVSAQVPTPQIFKVVPSVNDSARPWVTGWTPNQVEVEVLMDEESVGFAKVVTSETGTASFGWSPNYDLPVGWHEFRVRGKFGDNLSGPGAILGYRVEPPTPKPTIVEPEQHPDYVLIKGLVKNDLSVKIFIDGVKMADYQVPNHLSGTTNYWYKAKGLLNGVHEVYVVAYDKTGKLSKKSEIISFKTEMQKLTKGEDVEIEMTKEDESEVANQVIDEQQEGQVTIVEPESDMDVNVTEASDKQVDIEIVADDEKFKESMATTEEEVTADGEVSSISEEIDMGTEEVDETATSQADQEHRNRVVGLIILGIIAVILFIWYSIEKKKYLQETGKKSNDDNNKI